MERPEVQPNKVISVAFVDLVDLLERSGPSNAAATNSDDSIEIVSTGPKRLRSISLSSSSSTSPTASPPKRSRLSPSAGGLSVLKLSLALTFPTPTPRLPGQKTFLSTLAKSPSLHHPHELTPVSFTQKRGPLGEAHRLAITLPAAGHHALVPLLELDPLDATNELSWKWSQKGKHRVPSLGEGGLLDALVALRTKGVQLDASLSIEPSEEQTTFHLSIAVTLLKAFYDDRHYSPSKHLLLDHLFPSPAPPLDYPGTTTVDFFYHSLLRAPRTSSGLPLANSRAKFAQVVKSPDELVADARRKQKGKGKARDQDRSEVEMDDDEFGGGAQEDGEEDDLLYPPGLKATLMPFQSRSVRWLLAREGKVAVPVAEAEEGDVEMREPTPPEEDDDEMESELVEQEKEPHPKFVLRDLPEHMQKDLARGPLWERIKLDLPEGEDGEERSVEVWLNRVASQIAMDDPALGAKADAVEEDEEEDDKVLATLAGSGQGLLSEEMGLGKTVEIISLILLHRAPERNALPVYHNFDVDSTVKPTDLTLIIAPSAIVAQWKSEIEKHAPSLRVLRYENTKAIKETWTPVYIAKHYDIILTTFDVLRREVVLARKPHERALRSGPQGRHRYRRSLLVQIDFLRVIMDEAQMVGDTVSLTSETASLIPRRYSFAVTGTPLKARIEDLQGLLRFLKVEPIGSNRAYLTRLLEEVPTFVRLCESLAARTVKAQVGNELVIPAQHRFVVPVNLTAVEKYWYDARYLEALEALGLESDGSPKDNGVDADGNVDWTLDKSEMNRWLVALRQLCCHPQVGQGNKRVLGSALKTVEDVLSTMKEAAVSAVQTDQRALWVARVHRAQIMTYDYEDCERFENALVIFKKAHAELEPLVQELVLAIRDAWKDRKAERVRRGRSSSAGTDSSHGEGPTVGGALGLGLDDEEKAGEIPLSEKEKSIAVSLGALRNRLREILLVQHAALFFSGATYFNMGKFSDEERQAYADAEELRQTILKPYEERVELAAARLRGQMDARDKTRKFSIQQLEVEFATTGHGLIGAHIFEDIDTCADVMNGYGELIYSWRETILGIMYQRVSISGDDATGDEYAERGEQQEKCDVYLEAYASLLSDWRFGLTGERTALDEVLDLEAHGYGQKADWIAAEGSKRSRVKKGDKKGQQKKQKLKDHAPPSIDRGDSPREVLRYELLVEHSEAKGEGNEDVEIVPIRNSLKALKDAMERTTREEEEEMLDIEFRRLKAVLADKEKLLERLRGELSDITKAFNARLQYFKQLQIVSDDVRDPEFLDGKWKGFPIEMNLLLLEEERLQVAITKKSSQRRYLESLAEDGTQTEEEAACVICSSEYTHGVLTNCGHVFCQDCFNAWHHRSRTCAICKRELRAGDYQSVKLRRPAQDADDDDAPEKDLYEDVDPVTFEAPVRLRTIESEELEEIEKIETVAPLSSKSDLIVKHVKLIRTGDPTAKIVIFSAWIEALDILMQAFARNGIQYVRLEGGGKKEAVVTRFIQDPAVAAFFLHTKSQSAGLNLTCAQYVFLVEPLLHPSLELQAVGRTHRIGQKKETHVYQYIVQDSVDQRLADLRGRNKSSLFLASGNTTAAKESRILQEDMAKIEPADKKGSEETIEDEDDISRVLFTPEHFVNVQRALLPVALRGKKKVQPTRSMLAAEAAERRAAGPAGGGGIVIRD